MTDKNVNYSNDAIVELRAGYDVKADYKTRSEQVKALATSLGKSVQSIRMKLTQLGLYIPQEKPKSTAKKKITKAEHITTLCKMLECAEIDGLDNCTISTIVELQNAIKNLKG